VEKKRAKATTRSRLTTRNDGHPNAVIPPALVFAEIAIGTRVKEAGMRVKNSQHSRNGSGIERVICIHRGRVIFLNDGQYASERLHRILQVIHVRGGRADSRGGVGRVARPLHPSHDPAPARRAGNHGAGVPDRRGRNLGRYRDGFGGIPCPGGMDTIGQPISFLCSDRTSVRSPCRNSRETRPKRGSSLQLLHGFSIIHALAPRRYDPPFEVPFFLGLLQARTFQNAMHVRS